MINQILSSMQYTIERFFCGLKVRTTPKSMVELHCEGEA
jgi:hypothetical protein